MAITKKKWKQEIKQAVEKEDCKLISIERGRKHLMVLIEIPSGLLRKVFAGASPSDSRRSRLNFRSAVRRVKNSAQENTPVA